MAKVTQLASMKRKMVPRSVGSLPIPSQADRHPSQAGFLVLGSAASVSFESVLEMQTLSPYPTHTDSASAFY